MMSNAEFNFYGNLEASKEVRPQKKEIQIVILSNLDALLLKIER